MKTRDDLDRDFELTHKSIVRAQYPGLDGTFYDYLLGAFYGSLAFLAVGFLWKVLEHFFP